jgi:hypothetical protein
MLETIGTNIAQGLSWNYGTVGANLEPGAVGTGMVPDAMGL